MQAILTRIPQEIFNFFVYTAIVVTMLLGLSKCVFPLRRYAYLFKRATRSLEVMVLKEGSGAVWQDPLFLGRPMQRQWKKYLLNLSHLSERGMQLNVEEYINDETVFASGVNLQLSDMLPSLLTSFGILGTFIGLMRGVGGLDVTNAGATMESISKMLGGMTFAYGTSIAGLVFSILFSILNRSAQGSATRAMDEFLLSFHDLVMPQGIDENVQGLCYKEDQAIFLKSSLNKLSSEVANGVKGMANELIKPVAAQMQGFISQASKEQVEGVHHIVMNFVAQMDRVLGGQLTSLGGTINGLIERQNMSTNSLRESQQHLQQLMASMQGINNGTAKVIELFEGYVARISASQDANKQLVSDTAGILSALNGILQKQTNNLNIIEEGQKRLCLQMEKSAVWTGKLLEQAEEKVNAMQKEARDVSKEMTMASKRMTDGVRYVSDGVDENIRRSVKTMEDSLKMAIEGLSEEIGKAKETKHAKA